MLKPRTAALWPPLVVAGLTGGIASGKSTLARMFAGLGAAVLNADDEGRDVVRPGEPALAEIVAAFGPGVLRPDGVLDRRAVAERIFSSRAERETLNRITHPRIAARLRGRLAALARRPPASRVVLLEAALLIEAGWVPLVDRVIVVVAQPSTQVARLIAEPGLTAAQAESRIRSQLPLSKRLRYADFTLSGEASPDESQAQVAAVWRSLKLLAHAGYPRVGDHPQAGTPDGARGQATGEGADLPGQRSCGDPGRSAAEDRRN